MSLYIRTTGKDKAQKILEELLTSHQKDITSYDLLEDKYDLSALPSHIIVDVRSVSRRGGSLTVTIASPVREYLGLVKGDMVALVVNKKIRKVYLEKVTFVQTST